jgi:hypothetical protein
MIEAFFVIVFNLFLNSEFESSNKYITPQPLEMKRQRGKGTKRRRRGGNGLR